MNDAGDKAFLAVLALGALVSTICIGALGLTVSTLIGGFTVLIMSIVVGLYVEQKVNEKDERKTRDMVNNILSDDNDDDNKSQ